MAKKRLKNIAEEIAEIRHLQNSKESDLRAAVQEHLKGLSSKTEKIEYLELQEKNYIFGLPIEVQASSGVCMYHLQPGTKLFFDEFLSKEKFRLELEYEYPSTRTVVTEGLNCLSKKWKGNLLMNSSDFKRLVDDITYIQEKKKLPSSKIKAFSAGNSEMPFPFYRRTIYNLWKKSNSTKGGTRDIWIKYISQAFQQFNPGMTAESLYPAFSKYGGSYQHDLNEILNS
jgi:hypothetical protein